MVLYPHSLSRGLVSGSRRDRVLRSVANYLLAACTPNRQRYCNTLESGSGQSGLATFLGCTALLVLLCLGMGNVCDRLVHKLVPQYLSIAFDILSKKS